METIFAEKHDEIAMAMLEPLASDNACCYCSPGYLERLRELCTEYNVLLCFDEIVNGFRLAPGGAQEYLGVTPDLCTLGKAMAGGLPFSCVAGTKEVMDIFHKKHVLGCGTFNGYGLGVHACVTAIKMYERNDWVLMKKSHRLTEKFVDGIDSLIEKHNVNMIIPWAPPCCWLYFGPKGGKQKVYETSFLQDLDSRFTDAFRIHMQDEGVLLSVGGKVLIDGGITDEDIDFVLNAFEKSLILTKQDEAEGYRTINSDGILDMMSTT